MQENIPIKEIVPDTPDIKIPEKSEKSLHIRKSQDKNQISENEKFFRVSYFLEKYSKLSPGFGFLY